MLFQILETSFKFIAPHSCSRISTTAPILRNIPYQWTRFETEAQPYFIKGTSLEVST
jgi:hypothetical protein